MLKRSELIDPRMKYTAAEIAEYNYAAYDKVANSMVLVRGRDKWVKPDIRKQIAK